MERASITERLEISAMTPRSGSTRLLLTLLTIAALPVAGCGNSRPNPTSPGAIVDPGRENAGSILGDEGFAGLFGVQKGSRDQGGALGVNAYLWRGALDTLSFMPLTSADPFGGVIITDWWTPVGGGERFKATAYILGKELRSDGVRLSVFRQELRGGQWVDAAVSKVIVGELENKVLDKARKLREQASGAG
jgi:hypothetical protein